MVTTTFLQRAEEQLRPQHNIQHAERQVLSLPVPLWVGTAGTSNADGKTASATERAKTF